VTGRRGLAASLLLALAGAVLLLVAAGRGWVSVSARTGPVALPGAALSVTGGELSGVPEACGIVGLAGVAGLLATRRAGRRLVGAVVALAGAGSAAAVADLLAGLRPAVARVLAGHAGGFPIGNAPLHLNGWPAAALIGGVLLAAAGVLAAAAGPRWAALSSARYSAAGARPVATPADGDVAVWDALDRGEDPTGAGRAGPPGHPPLRLPCRGSAARRAPAPAPAPPPSGPGDPP
jgi:uncharacterized membrane protein (TIGR02234 family)